MKKITFKDYKQLLKDYEMLSSKYKDLYDLALRTIKHNKELLNESRKLREIGLIVRDCHFLK